MPQKPSAVDEEILRARGTVTPEYLMFQRLTGWRERGTSASVPQVQPRVTGRKTGYDLLGGDMTPPVPERKEKPRRGSRNDTPLYSDPTILDTMPRHPMLRPWGGAKKRAGRQAEWPNVGAGLWAIANDWQTLADADRKAGRPVRAPIQWGDAALPGGGPLPREKVNKYGRPEALGHRGNDVDIAVVGGLNASPRDEQRTIELMRLALKHGAAELYFEGDQKGTFKTPLPPDVLDKVRRGFGEKDHFHARWPVFRGNFSPMP